MGEAVRFGVLGCGRIVRKAFLPVIAAVPQARFVAIASERRGVAADVVRELQAEGTIIGAVDAHESYADLLARSDLDAVYIPASGERHGELTIAAARAGKHVLCEKPLARSMEEARAMREACDAAGVLLQEAFMWRHHPRATTTHELVRSGAIGTLRLINVSFSFTVAEGDWRLWPERGGGAMWDLGCYGVDAARFFTDAEPTDVHARAHFGETGVDLTMLMSLTFPGEVLVHVDCSFEAPWRCEVELVGSTGRIVLPTAFQQTHPVVRLWQTHRRDAEPEEITCTSESQYGFQLAAFCASVAAGRLLPPAEDGLKNMEILCRALEQARLHESPT